MDRKNADFWLAEISSRGTLVDSPAGKVFFFDEHAVIFVQSKGSEARLMALYGLPTIPLSANLESLTAMLRDGIHGDSGWAEFELDWQVSEHGLSVLLGLALDHEPSSAEDLIALAQRCSGKGQELSLLLLSKI